MREHHRKNERVETLEEGLFAWMDHQPEDRRDELVGILRTWGYHGRLPWEISGIRPTDYQIVLLARQYGWKPNRISLLMHNGCEEGGLVLGQYLIPRHDVLGLADSLTRAVRDLPEWDRLKADREVVKLDGFYFMQIKHPENHPLTDYFSGPNKQWLRGFIDRVREACRCLLGDNLPYARVWTQELGPILPGRTEGSRVATTA
jgi:hypothetical protein